jgi:hypothetical protein
MTVGPRPAGPTSPVITYEVRVAGNLDDHWSVWFGAGAFARNNDGTTSLYVDVVDQAQLHGHLAGIRDIGVTLLSLNVVDGPAAAAGKSPGSA